MATTIHEMVQRFLTWPLPGDVAVDPCAMALNYPGRTGTALLTAPQARAMLEHVTRGSTQFCWLVENGKQQGDGLMYRYMSQGIPMWTPDPHKAIRFARREDAEMFAEEDEDAWRIVEHGFEA